jgi:hypothetical protein
VKLLEVVQRIPTLDGELTIYARQPWSHASDAELAIEGSEEEKKAKAAGLRYFIEVFVARDFLEDWRVSVKRPTGEQSCERLIEYATNDA